MEDRNKQKRKAEERRIKNFNFKKCYPSIFQKQWEFALSFFDHAISFKTKQLVVAKLQDEDDEQESLKRPQHPFSFPKDNTFFEILQLDSKFVHADPKFWSKIESFRSAKFLVKNLKSF